MHCRRFQSMILLWIKLLVLLIQFCTFVIPSQFNYSTSSLTSLGISACNELTGNFRTNIFFEALLPSDFKERICHNKRLCSERKVGKSLISDTKSIGLRASRVIPTRVPTPAPSTFRPTYSPFSRSTKKGIAHSGRDGSWLSKVKPNWYYNWRLEPTEGDGGIPFIPMVWGRGVDPTTNASIILGFNEPDFKTQSDISPREALELWPKIVHAGATLVGSPSPGIIESFWLREFLDGAVETNQKVDFICFHRYSWPDPKFFLDLVDMAYELYNMPIWITEFAVADWFATDSKSTRYTEQQVIKFMHEVIPALEERPFVHRYSWFSADINDNSLWFSALYKEDGSLTELGKLYSTF